VRAVLRRSVGAPGAEQSLDVDGVSIDLHRRVVTRDGEPIVLTRTEWMLLQHLAANPGRIMLNGELLSKVWGPEYKGDLQYLRVWVSRLRKKLEIDPSSPQLIKTFQGIGYMLEVPEEQQDEERATATAGGERAAS
jgi:two-component system KDP operon response regulator KdpE